MKRTLQRKFRPALLGAMGLTSLVLVSCAAGPIGLSTPSHPLKLELSYGTDPLQDMDFYQSAEPGAALVVFVHGGAWKGGDKSNATGRQKIEHFSALGYAFASVNYRLVPDVKVSQQAQDIASALAYLFKNASELGFDPARVVLMGHSAGAHLSALIGTDQHYLEQVGLSEDALRGVILLDGAAYDIPGQISASGWAMRGTYLEAFGSQAEAQAGLSPIHFAAKPNAPAFLILHVEREDGTAQAKALSEALNLAGTPADIHGFEGKGIAGHLAINRRLGDPDYPATAVVDGWLKKVFTD